MQDSKFELLFFPDAQSVNRLRQVVMGAKRSLKVCVYHMTNRSMADGLVEMHKRGVDVQIITEKTMLSQPGSMEFLKIIKDGSKGRIRVRVASSLANSNKIMHVKYFIVDGTYLGFGSLNWTKQGLNVNDEMVGIVESKAAILRALTHFADRWSLSDPIDDEEVLDLSSVQAQNRRLQFQDDLLLEQPAPKKKIKIQSPEEKYEPSSEGEPFNLVINLSDEPILID